MTCDIFVIAYGRRPVMLFTALVAAASSLGSGKAETWGTLIVSRVRSSTWYNLALPLTIVQVFNGLAVSSFFTLGAALVSDCFFLHERCAYVMFETDCSSLMQIYYQRASYGSFHRLFN